MPEELLGDGSIDWTPRAAGMLVERASEILVDGRGSHAFGEVLAMAGEGLHVTRAAIIAAHPAQADNGPRMEVRHQWLRPGIARLSPASTGWLPYFPRWARELGAGRVLQGPVTDFPPDERWALEADGVQAIAVVPIVVGDRWYGHLSVDDTQRGRLWSTADIDLLASLAEAIGRGIGLRAAEAAAGRRAAAREAADAAADVISGASTWRTALPAALELLRAATRARSAWAYEMTARDDAARLIAEALAPGALPATIRGRRLKISEKAISRFVRGETLIGGTATTSDAGAAGGAVLADGDWLDSSLRWLGVSTWIAAPAIPYPDRPDAPGVGVGMDSEQPRGWDDGEREALELVAAAITERMRADLQATG
jgi:hypothetical protein